MWGRWSDDRGEYSEHMSDGFQLLVAALVAVPLLGILAIMLGGDPTQVANVVGRGIETLIPLVLIAAVILTIFGVASGR